MANRIRGTILPDPTTSTIRCNAGSNYRSNPEELARKARGACLTAALHTLCTRTVFFDG